MPETKLELYQQQFNSQHHELQPQPTPKKHIKIKHLENKKTNNWKTIYIYIYTIHKQTNNITPPTTHHLVEDGIVQGSVAHPQGSLHHDALLGQPHSSLAFCFFAAVRFAGSFWATEAGGFGRSRKRNMEKPMVFVKAPWRYYEHFWSPYFSFNYPNHIKESIEELFRFAGWP